MAHPWHHAESSARKFGGDPSDYFSVHAWFDATKAHFAAFPHRALRHHTLGIFEAEAVFGHVITNSAGRRIPTRFIGEQHVREDCGGRIPSVCDWLSRIRPAPWMGAGHLLNDEPEMTGDPAAAWRADVAAGRTLLGLQEWLARRDLAA